MGASGHWPGQAKARGALGTNTRTFGALRHCENLFGSLIFRFELFLGYEQDRQNFQNRIIGWWNYRNANLSSESKTNVSKMTVLMRP